MQRWFIVEVGILSHIIILFVILFAYHFGKVLPRCRTQARVNSLTHFIVIDTCEGCRICLLHHLLYFLFHVEISTAKMVVVLGVRRQILCID